jgi:hypothetical protein
MFRRPLLLHLSMHLLLLAPGFRGCQAIAAEGQGTVDALVTRIKSEGEWSTVIVSVPDPSKTHYLLAFDRAISAIQQGMEDGGWYLAVRSIPWYRRAPDKAVTQKQDDRSHKKEEKSPPIDSRNGDPGLLTFRAKDHRRMALLLVGEQGTAGLNVAQFEHARCLAYQLENPSILLSSCAERAMEVDDRLKHFQPSIVAPYFSSSADALDRLLVTRPRTFLSGTATSTDALKRLKAKGLQLTMHDDEQLRCAFVDFLVSTRRYTGSTIALLSEEDTAYGAQYERTPASCVGRLDEAKIRVLSIRFPRGLASLRAAYQEAARPNEAQAAPAENWSLRNRNDNPGSDLSLYFSQIHTPLSEESVLRQIARSLHLERARFVVITATDILDSLFLSEYLGRVVPDARQVFYTSDLLRVRSGDSPGRVGSLVVNTYPLFLHNQIWTRSDDTSLRTISFPSSEAQGIYNAIRLTLKRRQLDFLDRQLLEYSSPFPSSRGTPNSKEPEAPPMQRASTTLPARQTQISQVSGQAQAQFSKGWEGRPALWVTAIGRHEPQPLAILHTKDEGGLVASAGKGHNPAAETPKPPPMGSTWFGLFVCLTGVCLLYFGLCTWPIRLGSWFPPALEKHRQSRLYTSWAGLALFALYLSFTLPAVALYVWGAAPSGFEFREFCFALLAAGATLWTGCTYSWKKRHLSRYVPPLVLAGAFALTFAYLIFASDDFYSGYFFCYRALQIWSGVSPTLPMLLILLAPLFWAVTTNRRVVCARYRVPALPSAGQNWRPQMNQLAAKIARLVDPFSECARNLTEGVLRALCNEAGAILLGSLFFFGWLLSRRQQMLESKLFEAIYFGAVAFVGTLVVQNTIRYALVWGELRKFLHLLELHPIREAFSLMPKDVVWSPLWQYSGIRRSMLNFSRSRECLDGWVVAARKTHIEAPAYWETKVQAHQVGTRVNVIVKRYLLRGRLHADSNKLLESNLAMIADSFFDFLREHWHRGHSDSMSQIAKDEKRPLSTEQHIILAQEFVALRYLHFIRYSILQMRNLFHFVWIGFTLMVLSLLSYPLHSSSLVGAFVTSTFLGLSAVIVLVLAQMERDPLLSRITETKAGVLGFNFYKNVLTYGALPLLATLAAQFPELRSILESWVQPALKAIR